MLGLVIKANSNLFSLIDHVVVRQDVPGLIDNETCSCAAAPEIAVRRIGGSRGSGTTEEIEEIKRISWLIGIPAPRPNIFDGCFRVDVDHAWINTGSNLGKCVGERYGI